jgi:carotenoid cleavage dioxygenase
MNGMIKIDVDTGATSRNRHGEQRYGGEVHFAARTHCSYAEVGYLIVFVQELIKDQSECLIRDAQAIERGSIAAVVLPERIQTGTHACWIEGVRLNVERPSASAQNALAHED